MTPHMTRVSFILFLSLLAISTAGCNAVPLYQYRQSQFQTLSMYRQNQAMAGQLASAGQSASQLAMETAQYQQELQIANERLANLGAERQELHSRYATLLTSLSSGDNPLSSGATQRFEELARKYPEFEFDPYTGVSKFTGDLLFSTGSSKIRSEAKPVLQEFAKILNSGDAQQFKILVVGHTDDQPVKKASTKSKHANNWELSAHRATTVVEALGKQGLAEHRMGIAGYSKYQPIAANANDSSRQRNRRVEIYILAPDDKIASTAAARPYF